MTRLKELEEAKNSELYGHRIGDMTKDDLMLHIIRAYATIASQREVHTDELISWIGNTEEGNNL
tara:strand:- start:599 stop:790 length:192 start_codon:yes stop_codon:yes gene_type:complete